MKLCPSLEENLAMRRAVELRQELGFQRVTLDGDAEVIFNAVQKPEETWE